MSVPLSQLVDELDHSLRWRRRACLVLTLGRHAWGEHWAAHVGEVGFEESADTLLGRFRQCRVCCQCEEVSP